MATRGWLIGGVLLVTLSALLLVKLWNQTTELDAMLEESRRREAELSEHLDDARQLADRERDVSEQAREKAQKADRARSEAELEREIARGEAERSREESELARAEAEQRRREYERIRDARSQELDRMEKALSKIAPTERTPMGMVMTLSEDSLLFPFDKAAIRIEDREILSRISGVLLASHGYHIYVDGHTDDQGDPRYNQGLSERRAKAVLDYLSKAGVPANTMQVRGFGQANPRRKGATPAARRKNRRVEIGIVDTVIDYEAAEGK